MISDTLHELAGEIERYQRATPEVYDSMRGEIDAVKTAVLALAKKLDTPPSLRAPELK